MGVFGPVIEALVLTMLDPGHDLPLGSGVALQLVGDERCGNHLGAIRHPFDGLVTGQMVPVKLTASVRGPCHVAPPKVGFAVDSPLEGDGFELSVPLRATAPAISFPEIRNPFSSK